MWENHAGIDNIELNGEVIEDPRKIVQCLNDHFLSASPVPSSHVGETMAIESVAVLDEEHSLLLEFAPTTPDEVLKHMHSLSNSRSAGWDELPIGVIKACRYSLAPILSRLINKAFVDGQFPDSLKYAIVSPIHKKGKKNLASNYRPISMLPSFSKVYEKCIHERLTNHLKDNDLLDENQFGFREGRSTVSAIHQVIDAVLRALDGSQKVGGVFCDLSRAFDCVNHNILIGKLERYGVRGRALDLLKSFLTGRKQSVALREPVGCRSQWADIRCGVPQGSILGPILFSIYINDLVSNKSISNLTLFADDTTALTMAPGADQLNENLKSLLTGLERWFNVNGLHLNVKKTQVMQFKTDNSCVSSGSKEAPIFLKNVKYLGLLIDENLKWDNHIEKLCAKLKSVCFVLRRLSLVADRETCLMVYYGYAYSLISYGVIFWGNASDSVRVFKIQKRMIRILAGVNSREHCRSLFKTLRVLTLPSIYIYQVLTFWKTNPQLFENFKTRHTYNTRHREDLVYPVHRLTLLEQGPRYSALRLHNALPGHIRGATTTEGFKRALKKFLMEGAFYKVKDFLLSGQVSSTEL